MTTNIFVIHESIFLLYEMMYNNNIYFHYIRRYIMTTNIFMYQEMFVVIIHRLVSLIIRHDV